MSTKPGQLQYDHLDLATLRLIWRTHQPRFIAPLGNGTLIAKAIGADKTELADWGDTIAIGRESFVTLVPAHHWSARTLGDRRMALWCGFVIQSPAGIVYNVGALGITAWSPEQVVCFKRDCKAKVSYTFIRKRLERLGEIGQGQFADIKFQKLEERLFGVPFYRRRHRSADSAKSAPRI